MHLSMYFHCPLRDTKGYSGEFDVTVIVNSIDVVDLVFGDLDQYS